MSQNQKALFIIFGGTGDLAYRRLYPALYQLYLKGYLNNNFAVIGTARRPWSDDYYQQVVIDSIDGIKETEQDAKEFASHFYYQSHNVNDTENYHQLQELANNLDTKYSIEGNRIFYLSVSPNFFGTISSHLRTENLVSDTGTGFNRLIIEKPFGTNFENSSELNDEILESFSEEQIYRIDHYLGKEMIQNILALRFANPLFKRVWNNEYISNFQVTLAEDIGVEERGGYYDQTGALRDMVQNHVLQIVSLLLMDEPSSFDSNALSDAKVAALKSLKRINKDNVSDNFVRGQYTLSGEHSDISDYLSENQVDSKSQTETFVAGKIESNNEKWIGVPTYIRTGKRMKTQNTQVDVVFNSVESALFPTDNTTQNVLSIHIGPEERLSLQLNNKVIGFDYLTNPIALTHSFNDEEIPDDYERLILSALKADKTNFVHAKEVAESWKYIDAIRAGWLDDDSNLYLYPVYENGPVEANTLLENDGNYWHWNG